MILAADHWVRATALTNRRVVAGNALDASGGDCLVISLQAGVACVRIMIKRHDIGSRLVLDAIIEPDIDFVGVPPVEVLVLRLDRTILRKDDVAEGGRASHAAWVIRNAPVPASILISARLWEVHTPLAHGKADIVDCHLGVDGFGPGARGLGCGPGSSVREVDIGAAMLVRNCVEGQACFCCDGGMLHDDRVDHYLAFRLRVVGPSTDHTTPPTATIGRLRAASAVDGIFVRRRGSLVHPVTVLDCSIAARALGRTHWNRNKIGIGSSEGC